MMMERLQVTEAPIGFIGGGMIGGGIIGGGMIGGGMIGTIGMVIGGIIC